MRAARLLRLLLMLQNRGRQTSAALARELEVSPRTILRDVDAMTEAGLPIIVYQGNQGGIELGFRYRTRLTGLTQDEGRAMGLILSAKNPMIDALGLTSAAHLARTKLIESFPDQTRNMIDTVVAQFGLSVAPVPDDPRVAALARAVQAGRIARLRFTSRSEQEIHPTRMELNRDTWRVWDDMRENWIEHTAWGRVNISGKPIPGHDPDRSNRSG